MEEWERLLLELRDEFILREDELELLHRIDTQLLRSREPLQTTFNDIVIKTQELLKSDLTAVLLRRGSYLETAYSGDRSVLGQRLAVSMSLTGETLSSGLAINVPDVTAPPYAEKYVQIDGYAGPPLRSLLAAPIKVHETMVGVLSTESKRIGAFKPVHERIIMAIASQVAIALQRAQLFRQDKLFSDVDALIFAGQTPEDIVAGPESQNVVPAALQKVMESLQDLEHVPLSGADIMFLRGQNELEVVHSTNPTDVGIVLALDQSICGRAVLEKRVISIPDVSQEPGYRSMFGTATRSEIAIPILLGNTDFVIGVLNVESEEENAFEGFSQVLLENFADRVRTLLAFTKLRADVTETMELRNASDLLVAIGDQASNMIHRMNNTVGVMRLRVMELQELFNEGELGPDPFLRESLSALVALADQTLKMPDEVTRLLSKTGVTVNVNDVVQRVLRKFEMPRDIRVDLQLDENVPSLSLYSFDIVVQNLLQNAVDAMPDGGTLSVSTESVFSPDLAGGYVELSIADTGAGIPEDVLTRIFELNFSTKHSKGKGHGLGLWWIRNFVLRAKGNVTVSSSVGDGTEFVVKIPIEHAPDGRTE